MIIRTLILGTECRDKATGLMGTITHWHLDMGKRIDYLFQPKGINPENGQPVEKIPVEIERLETSDENFEEVDVPFEILGTVICAKSSGFSGMAVAFIRHINGCFHVYIQPEGVLPKTNSPIHKKDFDLRECSGEKITQLSEEALAKSKQDHPSPTGDGFQKIHVGQ